MLKRPEVTCYICKQTFQKEVKGAAHNRNYYRCADCLKKLQRRARRAR